ncbi:hypothetical protein GF339_04490 [candidate division KSB3 bacterium]|uniref:Uncharacterized protein n=1 Tax=candidate division KSB3 bacterium TaxID=2044937 RepID=A0A9D5Q526_9BACT|nr:hypothetical protein [candidate division KSB3 bacterium]MBD3323817.1 hypothetical protein [candidate division KSB3 bacterium]
MIIPKGKVVHEDLSTSYTDIHELLRDLRQNSFTGYCQVNFWEYRGTLFLDRGRIINALEELGNERNTGERAIKNILAKAEQKDGAVSVFQLQDEMVATLASVLNSKVKYRDLTTELTSLEKLISKLKKEEHSGYVEVLLNGDSGDGCIYFQDGRAMESVFRSSEGEMISGPNGFKKILGLSTEIGAVFNVFESDLSSIVMDNSISEEILLLFQDTFSSLENTLDARFGSGKFLEEFKRTSALRVNANNYPFLDPFAGEFVYKDKTLTFEGETSLEEFTTGVCDVLTQTIDHFKAKEDHISELIGTNIRPLKEERIQLIDRLKLDIKLPAVFGDQASTPPDTDQKDSEEREAKGGRLSRLFRRKEKAPDE